MSSTAHFQFSRRSLMKAAGSTLFVPLFVKRAFAQTATPVRPNLVLMMQTNGVNQANFWPTGTTFDSPILHDLLTDPQVGPKTTLVKGINLKKIGTPAGNGHDWGFHGLFSGYDNRTSGSGHFGGGPSVDQALIKKLPFHQRYPHIHCGVHAADYRIVNAGRSTFSCAAVGQQVPVELDIYALFTKVFSGIPAAGSTTPDPAATAAVMRRLAQRKSVLDAVAQDLTALQGRLGVSERGKVDAHLTAVREFEKRLSAAAGGGGGGVRPVSCGLVKPSKTGVPTGGQGNEANADALTQLFIEFIANAIACDMVGIISFQLGRGGEHFHYKWLNIPGMRADFHDDIAHKDRNGDTVAGQVMVAVGKYHTTLVTNLAKRLASFPQADAKTALDNSLVVWGNEVANGYHGLETYPIVLVGGAAGKLKKTGYMVTSAAPQPHHRLGCTIHNIMGDRVPGFGAMPDSGTIAGLELNLV